MAGLSSKLMTLLGLLNGSSSIVSDLLRTVIKKPEQDGKAKDEPAFSAIPTASPLSIRSEPDLSAEEVIRQVSRKLGVDAEFALGVARIESGLNPRARNEESGAVGLFQLMPIALDEVFRVRPDIYYEPPNGNVFDVTWNATVGIALLQIIAKNYLSVDISYPRTRDVLARVYGAYNIGIGNLRKLESGKIDTSVERAVRAQARSLSHLGAAGYLVSVANVLDQHMS